MCVGSGKAEVEQVLHFDDVGDYGERDECPRRFRTREMCIASCTPRNHGLERSARKLSRLKES